MVRRLGRKGFIMISLCRLIGIVVALLAVCPAAIHADVLLDVDFLIQRNADGTQLVTGWYDDAASDRGFPQRVYVGSLLPGSFDGDEPGIRAVSSGLPSGTTALPGSTALHLDLLPMTISSTTSNLFYWDGNGAVNFTSAKAGTTLGVSASGGFSVTADGSANIVASTNPFVVTSASGTIHKHPTYQLSAAGTPDEGLYLVSFGFRMAGFENALPAFLVLATDTFADTPQALAAGNWVDANLATTAVPEPGTLALTAIAAAGMMAAKRRRKVTAAASVAA
jgi:hypothetical protein